MITLYVLRADGGVERYPNFENAEVADGGALKVQPARGTSPYQIHIYSSIGWYEAWTKEEEEEDE